MKPVELAQEFLEVIPQAMWRIRAELRQHAQPADLTIPQFRVLAMLSRGERTLKEVAELIGTSTPAMSRMVDGLVRKGFVVREEDPVDRRALRLSLSGAGLKQVQGFKSSASESLALALEGFTPANLQALSEGLEAIRDLLHLDAPPLRASSSRASSVHVSREVHP